MARTPKNYEIEMTEGPILGKMLAFSLPLMLSSILQLLFGAVNLAVIGNFSGKSMNGVSGGFGAARVFHQVIRLVTERQKPRFFYPENLQEITLCRKSGLRPAPGCPVYKELLEAGHHEIPLCGMNHGGMPVASENSEDIPRILSPVQGEVYILDPLAPSGDQSVPVRITTGKKSEIGRAHV